MADPFLGHVTGVVATWAGTYLLHSTALLLTAWGVTRLFTLPPVVVDVLWKTALVAGVVTASAAVVAARSEGGLAGGPAFDGAIRAVFIEQEVVRVFEGQATDGQTRGDRLDVRAQRTPGGPTEATGGPTEATGVRATMVTTPSGLAGWPVVALIAGWLAVAALGLVRLLFLWRELRLLRAHFDEPTARSRSLLQALSRGLPGVEVVRCDAVEAPCVLPGRTIALPGRCEDEMSDGELRAVLGHELGHIARNDVRWSGLLRGVSTALWIQPLNWFALARVREAAELICDDWALSRTDDSYGLAASIARVAEWTVRRTPSLGVSMAGDSRRLADRVRRILNGEGGGRVPRWVAPLVIGLLLLPTFWLPVVHPLAVHQRITVERESVMVGDSTGFRGFETAPMGSERRLVVARLRRG